MKMEVISTKVPSDVKHAFAKWCWTREMKQSAVIRQLLENLVQEGSERGVSK
jgi:antitoxin component of RelBE/YafQ-DinJ toxin-antitoxin module